MDWKTEELERALQRGLWIIEWLVEAGIVANRQAASRQLKQLKKERRARCVGNVQLNETGRGPDVYTSVPANRIKAGVEHETIVTKLELLQIPMLRFNDVNQTLRPDCTLLFREPIHGEVETGQNRKSQIRFNAYRRTNELVLWVAMTDLRLKGIIEGSKDIWNTSLFTTVDKMTTEWCDASGRWESVNKLLGRTETVMPTLCSGENNANRDAAK